MITELGFTPLQLFAHVRLFPAESWEIYQTWYFVQRNTYLANVDVVGITFLGKQSTFVPDERFHFSPFYVGVVVCKVTFVVMPSSSGIIIEWFLLKTIFKTCVCFQFPIWVGKTFTFPILTSSPVQIFSIMSHTILLIYIPLISNTSGTRRLYLMVTRHLHAICGRDSGKITIGVREYPRVLGTVGDLLVNDPDTVTRFRHWEGASERVLHRGLTISSDLPEDATARVPKGETAGSGWVTIAFCAGGVKRFLSAWCGCRCVHPIRVFAGHVLHLKTKKNEFLQGCQVMPYVVKVFAGPTNHHYLLKVCIFTAATGAV